MGLEMMSPRAELSDNQVHRKGCHTDRMTVVPTVKMEEPSLLSLVMTLDYTAVALLKTILEIALPWMEKLEKDGDVLDFEAFMVCQVPPLIVV